ncbi:carbon-nitrogen hydrolase family protein [candidate division KSB1 bacterium]|nr:carbon-nitrogen hydrolase family protein [candidate division KSB1 bacterium]
MKIKLIFVSLILILAGAAMSKQQPEKSRMVKIACVQWRNDSTASMQNNLKRVFGYIDEAAQNEADIVALPENVLAAGIQGALYRDAAEEITGPNVSRVRQKAAQCSINVIFPIIEKVADKLFNTAIVIDRKGSVVGSYRKTHEPKAVIEMMGVSLGDLFPVFELDFGKIGIMICYDIRFPEVIEILALNGAEIVFFPHVIGLPSQFDWEVNLRSRAMDNCVYLASSATMSHNFQLPENTLGKTAIIGKDGAIIANQGDEDGILYTTLDLSLPRMTDGWGEFGRANWEKLYWQERRPEIYKRIIEE